ncbi:GntR family transcriptional regulator [Gehongia tenuis]|uniref:GntR family transcriptional regulator n=1 Tax=Gehongia tenuis TaxID=2763655 RepID=A0A926HNE8_9FIRM|nr:GntR family transcriptional regulator [Gehongia tenuis]MBC8530524.1 GntR family transcriptional regulator [Gehongia tenuis]
MLDRTSSVPLAMQLARELTLKIEQGEYPAYSLFPTEEKLTERYGVSRTTVRQALAYLADDGLIRREQGRGTFVNAPAFMGGRRVSRSVQYLKGTSGLIEAAGMKSSVKVLKFGSEEASADVAENLKIAPGATVWYCERLRLGDGLPVMIERLWVPQYLCGELSSTDMEGSFYTVLKERFGLEPKSAGQRLYAVTLSGEDAKLFDQEGGAPAFFVEGVTRLAGGWPVEYENSLLNSQLVVMEMDLGASSMRIQ